MKIPAEYQFIDVYESSRQPGTVHCKNSALFYYYCRYLIQKLISVFEFRGLPETWPLNYLQYNLFCYGYVAIIDTEKYGIIPQQCGIGGFNVFKQPQWATIANGLLPEIKQPYIGIDCELLKLQPDYGSPMDLVGTYAELLALCLESAGVNLLNSKLAYVFAAQDKNTAESFKKMFDQIASGQPAAFVDKNLFNEDGTKNWDVFFQNLKSNYVAGDILNDMAKIENQFNTACGIPNANTEKRERLITDEVNANNAETETLVTLWLETMREDLRKINKMFDLNITVNYRFERGTENAQGFAIASDALSL